jgi:hypothetical protein
MMLPPKVRRSTMAAQRRGSVKVLVQREKDSLEAMATLFFSSRSVRTWKRSSTAAAVEFHAAEFVVAEEVDAAVTGDGLGQLPPIGCIDQLRGERVADAVALHGGLGAQRDQQVGLAGAGVADQTERLTPLDPFTAGEGMDGGCVDVRVGLEVESPQGLLPREARGLEDGARTLPWSAEPMSGWEAEKQFHSHYQSGQAVNLRLHGGGGCQSRRVPDAAARAVHHRLYGPPLLRFSVWGRWGEGQAGGSEAAVDEAGSELDSA